MKKSVCITILGLFVFSLIYAQSIERQVIGSAGNYTQSGDFQLSSTLGEVAVETKTQGNLTITQGFQQASASTGVSVEELKIELSYNVFPNPASNTLYVELKSDSKIELQTYITDLTGQQIGASKLITVNNSMNTESFDLSLLATAAYLLVIRDDKQIHKAIKIQVIR